MLKGFVDAYKALNEKKYLDIALQNANFIINKLSSPEGNLYRTYKNGNATINAYLEDYAHVIQGYIALYEATFDESWLQNAKQLTDYCFDNFYDEQAQFFSFTSQKDINLITAHFEVEDNVIPAANSVMSNNLFRLSIYFNNSYYETIARQMVQNIIPLVDYPSAYSNWLNALLNFSEKNKELAICGEKALDYLMKIHQNYLPNIIISGTSVQSQLPFLVNRFVKNETLLYLCQNKTCNIPTADFEQILEKIRNIVIHNQLKTTTMGLGDFFKNLFGGAKGKATDTADNFIDDAIDKAKEMAEPMMDKVEDFVETAKEKITEYVPQAADTIDNFVDSAKEKMANFSDSAQETAKEKVSSFADDASENAEDAVKNVTNRVEEDAD